MWTHKDLLYFCVKTINMQFTWGGPSFNANVNIVWQVEELRQRVRELEERERKESKKLADEDALRKIRVAEETIEHLQKKLAATKQVSSWTELLSTFVSESM